MSPISIVESHSPAWFHNIRLCSNCLTRPPLRVQGLFSLWLRRAAQKRRPHRPACCRAVDCLRPRSPHTGGRMMRLCRIWCIGVGGAEWVTEGILRVGGDKEAIPLFPPSICWRDDGAIAMRLLLKTQSRAMRASSAVVKRTLQRPDRLAHHLARHPQITRYRLDRPATRMLPPNPYTHQYPYLVTWKTRPLPKSSR